MTKMDAPATIEAVISRETKVNLGLLLTLISLCVAGTLYASSIKGDLEHLTEVMVEVRQAIDTATKQIALDGQERAVQRTLMAAMQHRIEVLEKEMALLRSK